MKYIKNLFTLVCTLVFLNINGQEKKIKFNKGTLKICSSKSFVIEGYDGDEVIIESLHEKRPTSSFSYFPVNKKNKKDKKGDWEVTATAVSGVYTENDNDTLARPKQIYFNNNHNFKKLGEKNKKQKWVVTPGVSNISFFETEPGSLKKQNPVLFNYFDANRKEGLKRLGKKNDNTALGIYFIIEQNGDELTFKDNTESSFIMSANREQYKIKIPNSLKLIWTKDCSTKTKGRNYFFFNSEKSSLSNFDGEVAISSTVQDIKLKDVTGPVSINTIGGNVTIVFDEKLPKKLYSIYSNNGFIDLTLPKKSDINVDASAIAIYSDIDFKTLEDKEAGNIQNMKLKLNRGNVKLKLNANLGTIYLRKK